MKSTIVSIQFYALLISFHFIFFPRSFRLQSSVQKSVPKRKIPKGKRRKIGYRKKVSHLNFLLNFDISILLERSICKSRFLDSNRIFPYPFN